MKCPKCQTENQNDSKFCINCGESLTVIPYPTVITSSNEGIRPSGFQSTRYTQSKDPTLAVILSGIIPGLALGQFYNGDVLKGIVMLVGSLILGWTGLGLIAIWVWSLVDAYQVAKGNQRLWR